MQRVAYALHVELGALDQQVQIRDYDDHGVVACPASQQEVLVVLVADAVPLPHHLLVSALLFLVGRDQPLRLQEIPERFERFLQIRVLFGRHESVHEEVLEAAVAVHAYGLFAQFGEGQLRVEQRVGYAGGHLLGLGQGSQLGAERGCEGLVRAEEVAEGAGGVRADLSLQFVFDAAEGLFCVEGHVDGSIGAREVVLQEKAHPEHFEEAAEMTRLVRQCFGEQLDSGCV